MGKAPIVHTTTHNFEAYHEARKQLEVIEDARNAVIAETIYFEEKIAKIQQDMEARRVVLMQERLAKAGPDLDEEALQEIVDRHVQSAGSLVAKLGAGDGIDLRVTAADGSYISVVHSSRFSTKIIAEKEYDLKVAAAREAGKITKFNAPQPWIVLHREDVQRLVDSKDFRNLAVKATGLRKVVTKMVENGEKALDTVHFHKTYAVHIGPPLVDVD